MPEGEELVELPEKFHFVKKPCKFDNKIRTKRLEIKNELDYLQQVNADCRQALLSQIRTTEIMRQMRCRFLMHKSSSKMMRFNKFCFIKF